MNWTIATCPACGTTVHPGRQHVCEPAGAFTLDPVAPAARAVIATRTGRSIGTVRLGDDGRWRAHDLRGVQVGPPRTHQREAALDVWWDAGSGW